MDFDKWLEEAGVKLDQLKGDAYAKLKAEKRLGASAGSSGHRRRL